MTVRRFDPTTIGHWLAYKARLGPEPPGLDLPRLVVQPANRARVSEASGRKTLLPAGEPQVLGFEDRPLRLGERMVIARDRPGFEVRRARWRTFGPGESVRVAVGGDSTEGIVRLQTIRSYLERYVRTPERGSADASGAPCRLGTTGPLIMRPTVAHGVRRVGKEAHDVGEWVVHPTRPADYGATTADPARRGNRAFRDACRILGRAFRDGHAVRVRDDRGREIPETEVCRAITTRRAPAELRRAIVSGAAASTGRVALEPRDAVRLAARTCVEPRCSTSVEGRSPRCPPHRADAERARSRRYRARRREPRA